MRAVKLAIRYADMHRDWSYARLAQKVYVSAAIVESILKKYRPDLLR